MGRFTEVTETKTTTLNPLSFSQRPDPRFADLSLGLSLVDHLWRFPYCWSLWAATVAPRAKSLPNA
jgi:hypothetical protein